MVKNRRIGERVSTNLPARWDGVSGRHEARIEDLSVGGCFVNTTSRVDVGENVGVEMRLPSGEWLKLRGDVTAYQIGIGFGVLFTSLTEEQEKTIREIMS